MRRHPFRGLLVCCGLSLLGWSALVLSGKPPLLDHIPLSQAVYDRHHRLLRLTLAADEQYRLFVPLAHVTPHLTEALLLKEDRFFWHHPGINPVSLLRAAYQTVRHPHQPIGGSTITMQVVRLRDRRETRSVRGKFRQILEAVRLEHAYSKEEILAAYLTLMPCGRNIEGIGAASLIYFRKPPAQLTLPEILTLAVLPQSPSLRTPDRRELHAQRAMHVARQRLLRAWDATHHVPETLHAVLQVPLHVDSRADIPFEAPHVVNRLLAQSPTPSAIISTIDLDLQHTVERQVRHFVERHRHVGIRNAAVMVLNWETMAVEASLGSADFFDDTIQGQVDGTRARRSPGSALKPFAYALAIDQGLIHPYSLLKDSPTSFGGYDPENFDHQCVGPIAASDALVRSRNIPAVAIAAQLRAPSFYDFLQRAGIGNLREPAFYGLTTVLGGAEVTMEELVRLYAMLANQGRLQPLRYTTAAPPPAPMASLISPEASFLVLDMLKTNPRLAGDDALARHGHAIPVAWKTGTSFAHRDAWTVGIRGPYVIAVWVGNFDGKSDPILVGREVAAPLFFTLVHQLPVETTTPPLLAGNPPRNANLRRVPVCATSGDLPGPHCLRTRTTWFIPGRSPIRQCGIHRDMAIDVATGLRACPSTPSTAVRTEVFEFWPSDLAALFRLAGLPRREPPPYPPDCPLQIRTIAGKAPHIVSPKPDVIYYVREDLADRNRIALKAISDAGTRQLYWFADQTFLGSSPPNRALFWTAQPGRFGLRVVDDNGYSDQHTIDIRLTPL
ncbi:MAG: penicillin-binding protein 1C [Deltaproteobacteria bacterium]|nr:penicillin-binding protein 1C [Deltaproteobacteria bacterium]